MSDRLIRSIRRDAGIARTIARRMDSTNADDRVRQAAQAVIDRWDTPLWKDVPATAEYINRLRAALAATAAPTTPPPAESTTPP